MLHSPLIKTDELPNRCTAACPASDLLHKVIPHPDLGLLGGTVADKSMVQARGLVIQSGTESGEGMH